MCNERQAGQRGGGVGQRVSEQCLGDVDVFHVDDEVGEVSLVVSGPQYVLQL